MVLKTKESYIWSVLFSSMKHKKIIFKRATALGRDFQNCHCQNLKFLYYVLWEQLTRGARNGKDGALFPSKFLPSRVFVIFIWEYNSDPKYTKKIRSVQTCRINRPRKCLKACIFSLQNRWPSWNESDRNTTMRLPRISHIPKPVHTSLGRYFQAPILGQIRHQDWRLIQDLPMISF